MNDRTQNKIVAAVFLAIIYGISLLCLFFPEGDISQSERRALAAAPSFSWRKCESGVLFDEFDEYVTDRFPSRDFWRGVKARFQTHILLSKENDSLAIKDGCIAKIEHKTNALSHKNAVDKIRKIYDAYLSNSRVFLSVIPDKNFFFARDFGYPSADYKALVEVLTESLPEVEYIDIFDTLALDDYYKTDTHWAQDKLGATVDKLAAGMGFSDRLAREYEKRAVENFYGVYAGQSALSPEPDTIYYLTNETIGNCTSRDLQTGERFPVYDVSKAGGRDAYDVFLSGARGLIRIDNPAAQNDDELIIFRDSFGSSISPLFIEAFRSVTLVDVRYIEPSALSEYIDFDDKDVLFLFSALLLGNSFSLK